MCMSTRRATAFRRLVVRQDGVQIENAKAFAGLNMPPDEADNGAGDDSDEVIRSKG